MLMLFPGELIVTQSYDGSVTLTTHRIWRERKRFGRPYYQSIMLENITSCEKRLLSYYWILVSGIVLAAIFIGSVNKNPEDLRNAIIAPIAVSVVLFLVIKHSVISIASPGIKIKISISGMNKEQVLSFIKN